jgi:hypothetical protein
MVPLDMSLPLYLMIAREFGSKGSSPLMKVGSALGLKVLEEWIVFEIQYFFCKL